MADAFSDFTALTTALADGDLLAVSDVSDTTDDAAGTSKKLTVANLFKNAPASSITGLTEVAVAAGDSFVLSDADGSGLPKRDTIQGILDLVSGGVWETISTTTLTTNSSVDFDLSSTTYRDFQFRIYNMAISAASDSVHLLFSTNGGSAFLSSGYAWAAGGMVVGVSHDGHGSDSSSEIEIGRHASGTNNWGTDAGENFSGTVDIFFPRGTGITTCMWMLGGENAASHGTSVHGHGHHTTAQDTTDVRFIPASGTFDGAVIELLGYKE